MLPPATFAPRAAICPPPRLRTLFATCDVPTPYARRCSCSPLVTSAFVLKPVAWRLNGARAVNEAGSNSEASHGWPSASVVSQRYPVKFSIE